MSASRSLPSLGRRVVHNPVLRRELLERWRGRRAFLVVTGELLVLMAMLLLLYWGGRSVLIDQARFDGGLAADAGPLLGRFVIDSTFAFALLFVLFIGPGYAAGQISGERERQTLGLLQITLVGPWGIVLGKLGAATAWLVLLAVVAIPLGAVGFFLGGAVWTDVVRGMFFIIVVAVSISAMAIGISSMVKRTSAAIVMSYGMVLLLVIGTLFGLLIETLVRDGRGLTNDRVWSLTVNPYLGLADALQTSPGTTLPNPLTPFAYALPTNRDDFFGGDFDVAVAEEPFPGNPNGAAPFDRPADIVQDIRVFDASASREPIWLEVAAIHLLFGVMWLTIAAKRVGMRGGRGGERLVDTAPSTPAAATAAMPPPPPGSVG